MNNFEKKRQKTYEKNCNFIVRLHKHYIKNHGTGHG